MGTEANHDQGSDPFSDPEERRVLYAALDSFRQYRSAAHYNITHLRRQSFYSLPEAQVDLLSAPPFSLPETFNAVDDAIDSNADISEAILQVGLQGFDVDPDDDSWKGKATPSDLDKARSTIRQLYREWSAEGLTERQAAFSPIHEALHRTLRSDNPVDRSKYRILVPGAGLGRLVLEICAEGYCVEGNEISYHQLLASNYILNFTQSKGQHTLFPWALNFSNHLRRADQLQAVSIPDVHPGAELESRSQSRDLDTAWSERMSMSAGDFCAAYKQPEARDSFDAVTTCFFVDTAPNVINYIETVKHCLRPGGLWINLGPLLWHFESSPTPAEREHQRQAQQHTQKQPPPDDSVGTQAKSTTAHNDGIGEPGSFELSDDELVALLERCGFEMQEHKQTSEPTGYIQDPQSMLRNVYHPSFWIARKR